MQNFNFHQHTYRCKHSDPKMQDEEYVQDYLKMGFKRVAFTDHCPEKETIDQRTNMRMAYEDRQEYLDSIKALREKYKDKIEILTGYEVEYLPGQEENLKELKAETDMLILGQHFIYDTDGESLKIIKQIEFNDADLDKYADYIEAACKAGIPDIIAHPDLFMKVRKSFSEKEEEITRRICEASIKYNVPLEINLNNIFSVIFFDRENRRAKDATKEEQYERLKNVSYPNKDFWKIVSEYDVRVVYGIDTHFRNQIPLYYDFVRLATEIIGQDVMDKLNWIHN